MNDLLNTAFGLDGLGFGTPDAVFMLDRPLPPWVWALLVILAGVLGVWTYRGLPGPPVRRAALGLLRGGLIVLLALLACGPALRLDRIITEPDRVYILVDQSQSMTVPDAPGAQTRSDQALRTSRTILDALDERAQRSEIVLWRFGSRTQPISIDTPESEITEPGTPDAAPLDPASRTGRAIADALEHARGSPIGAIVLLTDGRATDALTPDTRRRLDTERIPILGVPLGSPDPVRSIGVAQADSPGVAFLRDRVPVRAQIEWSGLPDPNALVQLVDAATGEVLDEQPAHAAESDTTQDNEQSQAAPPANRAWVTLNITPERPGTHNLEVRLVSVGDDIDPGDNARPVALEIIERPIRVLYIDGSPRWEHRFVKNLLLREPSIDASILLLASGRQYIQEGDTLIARLPISPEEWDAFDVIILGDLSGELFGSEQLAQLTEHVANRGAGVLWMAGPGSTPASWFETPAAPLLPLASADTRPWPEAVTIDATAESDRLGVLRTNDAGDGWNPRLRDPAAGWTRLQWTLAMPPSSLKPGTVVLADAIGVTTNERMPAVVTMRYGSGRTALVGTDEIWRWRYGRGETLPERFWIPLVRMLARGRVEAALGPGVLRVRPDRPRPDDAALIELEVFDQGVIDRLPDTVRAEVVRADGRRDTIALRGEGSTRSGVWTPDAPGAYRIELADATPELVGIEARTRVIEPGDERADLNTDHTALARLTEPNGGQMLPPNAADRIAELIPNRARVHAGTPAIETLWDRWIVLIGLLALLTLEWIARRLIRLT